MQPTTKTSSVSDELRHLADRMEGQELDSSTRAQMLQLTMEFDQATTRYLDRMYELLGVDLSDESLYEQAIGSDVEAVLDAGVDSEYEDEDSEIIAQSYIPDTELPDDPDKDYYDYRPGTESTLSPYDDEYDEDDTDMVGLDPDESLISIPSQPTSNGRKQVSYEA